MSGGRGVGVATICRGVGDGQGVWVNAGVAMGRRVGDGGGARLGVDVGEGLAVDVGMALGGWLGDGRGAWVGPDAAIAIRPGRTRVVARISQGDDSWLPS